MKKTQKHLLAFFIFTFYIFNFQFVSAENEKIEIESGTNKFKDLIFSVPPGSQHTGELVVYNKGEEEVNIVLFVAPDEETTLVEVMKKKKGDDLFINTFFYSDTPPEKYQELLKNNEGDITVLCKKYKDGDDKALIKWCEGDRSTTVTIGANELERIPFTVKFSSNVENHSAYVTVVLEDRHDDKILAQEKLIYKIPVKELETEKIKFESFAFKRSFTLANIFSWWKAGRREEHLAEFVVSNDDSLDANHQVFVRVKSDEEKLYELDVVTKAGKTETYNIKTSMPWFGKVEVVGGIKIETGEESQEFVSEKIEYFVIPVREIIIILLLMSSLLAWMWRKKEDLSNVIGGTSWIKYKIKQGDNIMGIAYRYGISWKELVYKNNIKPPYTLVLGNVIMVPPRPKKVFKNKFMQNKNNLDNLGDDRGVHKESFSNGIKIDVKGDGSESTVQMPERSRSEKKIVNGIGVRHSNGRDSVESSVNQRRESFEGERTQRDGIRGDRRQRLSNGNGGSRRNIDIKWMHEDDETFSEAMQDEVRAINFKIKIFVAVMIGLIGLVGYWFYQYGMKEEVSKETSSINDLLAGDDANAEEINSDENEDDEINSDQQENRENNEGDETGDDVVEENDNQENDNDSNNDNVTNEDDLNDVMNPAEISVQVLNGGAKSGVAGDLTNLFKNKLYKTKSAANATNNVAGVVVYYKSGLDKEMTELSKVVPQVYGATKLEESDDVTKKYGVDVIVVVGK